MTFKKLKQHVAAGEDSMRQFKSRIDNADSLTAEMAAFANAQGGLILIGVHDDGTIAGITPEAARAANQLISNTASQHIRSPLTVHTKNILLDNGNIVIVLDVPAALDKPYFDRPGIIWIKSGADKRKINSKEELRRLFQYTSQFYADELPIKAAIDRLDKLLFRDFLKQHYDAAFPDDTIQRWRLLQNLNLVASDGSLNLAGVLLFAEQPQLVFPQFVAKGARFPGTAIHADKYEDSEDFAGPLSRLFKDALAFVMRNLRKLQAGNGVNSPGTPEIPERVFEELIVNVLAHRDYLINSPVRIFIFDDRIEIINPGTLPNNLTIANIKSGNSIIRNPILISYAAKGLLPYHGIGSGITRALDAWPHIEFEDNRNNSLFKAIVYRKSARKTDMPSESNIAPETSRSPRNNPISGARLPAHAPEIAPENQDLYQNALFFGAKKDAFASKIAPEYGAILACIAANPHITVNMLAQAMHLGRRTVLNRLGALKEKGLLRRIGPNKGGYWEIIS